ncbi:NACHT domain- and WD repeat-containing protein 1-like isoform X2 [Anneissia japonica]|uniref:NACHT domain- and WD repeat-containing protein 1-like isoform X2 n=1 Tax=Anneissia japonica TaxID=1529436 RepID=UPI001425B43E|nr:NACHT domain- and WD repeat-containing protein 1-like isoform X2 [Anneissia japonica]
MASTISPPDQSKDATTMVKNIRAAVLLGNLKSLPKVPSKIVRIFVSSTFGDTVAERNILLEKAYPELKKWCQEKGLDFQVVDMRWGVRDEVNDDHMTLNICLREIENCQVLSVGPNVLFLLGQRYGWRPNPATIDAVEFETILKFAEEDENATSLLVNWYQRDENSDPPVFVLQPVTQDRKDEWIRNSSSLSRALRKAVEGAVEANEINQDRGKYYSMSVTEHEIKFALETETPDNHCVAFIRTLQHLEENLANPKAHSYTDFISYTSTEIDKEARDRLTTFKEKFIPSKLGEENIHKYCIDWTSEGVDISDEDHYKYLITFCTTFVKDVKRLVKKGLSESQLLELCQDSLFMEVLHHSKFCLLKCQNFCGRKELLHSIEKYLSNPEKTKPLVIHGPSGVGKTSVMAMVALEQQNKRDCQTVLRFLGTSSHTSTIFQVMLTIFSQICETYKLTIPADVKLKRFADLVKYFPVLLQQVSDVAKDKPLIILLDSIDQLQSAYDAYEVKWLPKQCPPNVKIVLSTLPDASHILDEMKEYLGDSECFMAVEALSEDTGEAILNSWMASINRKVTAEQFTVIREAFQECPQPIFLKLVFEEARRWKSYTSVSENDLAYTVREAIWQLFDRLERQFGRTVVSHALGYISASRNGVTEGELEDLLSIDDEVLDEIYQYWSPPNPNVVRLPPLLWARLHSEIREYMVDREADGRTVMALYHRQFIEASRDKYLKDDKERQARHQLMVDFFLGTWSGNQKKTLILNQLKRTLEADRKVSPQPIMFKDVFNYRKLNELPYHLLHAENEDQMIKHVLGNFDFLYAWVEAYKPQHVIEEMDMIIAYPTTSKQLTTELELVQDLLRLVKPTLEYAIILKQSNCLATDMLGRMLHFADTHTCIIKSLLEGATRWCQKHDKQLVYATRSCYPAPGGPHRATLVGHRGNIRDIAANAEGTLAVSASDDGTARLWDLIDGEPILTFTGHNGPVNCVALSANSTRVVTGSADNTLRVWDVDSGDEVRVIEEDHSAYTNHSLLCISHDSSKIISGSTEIIMVYEMNSGQDIHRLTGHTLPVSCICISNDDQILVSGSEDKSIKVWSVVTGNLLADRKEFEGEVSKVAITDDRHILAGDKSGGIKIFSTLKNDNGLDVTSKHAIQTPDDARVFSLCASNDGNWMVVAADRAVLVYSINDGSLKHTLTGHDDVIDCVAVTYSDKYIVSGARDNIMIVWDLSTGQLIENLEGQQVEVSNLVLTGDIVISTSVVSQYIKLWSTEEKYISHYNLFFRDQSGVIAITRDKNFVLHYSTNPPEVVVWCCQRREPVLSQKLHNARVTSIATCRDNNTVLSGDVEGVLLIWNINTTDVISKHAFKDSIRHISIRQDDQYAAVAHEKKISLWDIKTNTIVKTWSPQLEAQDIIECVLLTNDNQVLCGMNTGLVLVFGKDGTDVRSLSQCKSKVTCLALSPNEDVLAVGSENTCVPVWDWKKGILIKIIEETFSMVSMAFTEDGRYLVTGSADKLIRIWQLSDGSFYLSHYIYSDLVTMAVQDNEIIGGTRFGQPIVLAIHEKPANVLDALPSSSSTYGLVDSQNASSDTQAVTNGDPPIDVTPSEESNISLTLTAKEDELQRSSSRESFKSCNSTSDNKAENTLPVTPKKRKTSSVCQLI